MSRRFGMVWIAVLLILLAATWALAQEAPAPEAEEVASEQAETPDVQNEANPTEPKPVFPIPEPPAAVVVEDTSSDAGGSITVRISPSPSESEEVDPVVSYVLQRAVCQPKGFTTISIAASFILENAGKVTRQEPEIVVVDSDCVDGVDYYYRVMAVTRSGQHSRAVMSEPISSKPQWFAANKLNVLFIALVISFSIVFFIESIKRGKKPFVRKIAGLEAVDEAIGRATEMGRPILFIPGILDMNDVQTISAVIILGRIAHTIAEYDTKLMCPTSRSLVMTTARETVKEAYMTAGRPDSYSDDMITYLTDEQFGYVAGVNGIMVRDKPATCFYLGAFFAESLILAETGNSIGAIQIAGTAMPAQLPFFIAACDYTLIGEELFAASAYLSQEPKQLGSLKGQDVGKAIAMFFIVLGSLLVTIATLTQSDTMWAIADWVHGLFKIAT